jgi:hypothetical protein
MLEARSTEARPHCTNERLNLLQADLSKRQGIGIELQEVEQRGSGSTVAHERGFGQSTHTFEMGAVVSDYESARSRLGRRKHSLFIEVPCERVNDGRQIDVVLGVRGCKFQELRRGEVLDAANPTSLQKLLDPGRLPDS